MTEGTGPGRSRAASSSTQSIWRRVLFVCSLLLLVGCVIPPLVVLARRYEWVEALQFSLFAVGIPALLVLSAPWHVLGLSNGSVTEDPDGLAPSVSTLRPADRLALGRRRHREPYRAVFVAVLFLAVMVFWRTPVGVNGLVHHASLVALEGATLTAAGIALWLELVESLPLVPRLTRPHRIAMSAICMWTIWVMAYLVGLSGGSWYTAFAHHAGSGVSVSADQQLTTAVIWLISGCAFVPLVFWNLFKWLQAEEDPDQALHHLVRMERTRGGAAEGSRPSPS